MIPIVGWVSGAVRGTAGYSGDNWTFIDRSDRRLYCYTQTEETVEYRLSELIGTEEQIFRIIKSA